MRDRLAASGITVVPQYGVGGYRVDFAAAHPEDAGRMVLAIEADGASYQRIGQRPGPRPAARRAPAAARLELPPAVVHELVPGPAGRGVEAAGGLPAGRRRHRPGGSAAPAAPDPAPAAGPGSPTPPPGRPAMTWTSGRRPRSPASPPQAHRPGRRPAARLASPASRAQAPGSRRRRSRTQTPRLRRRAARADPPALVAAQPGADRRPRGAPQPGADPPARPATQPGAAASGLESARARRRPAHRAGPPGGRARVGFRDALIGVASQGLLPVVAGLADVPGRQPRLSQAAVGGARSPWLPSAAASSSAASYSARARSGWPAAARAPPRLRHASGPAASARPRGPPARPARPPARLRRPPARVARQDLLAQPLQVRGGLGTQLGHQHPAGLLVGGQCLARAPGPGQGQHQQRVEIFPQGEVDGQHAQLGDHLVQPAGPQVRLDPGGHDLLPELGQPRHLPR